MFYVFEIKKKNNLFTIDLLIKYFGIFSFNIYTIHYT